MVLTVGDYPLLIGAWEGNLVSKSPDRTIQFETKLRLEIVENGLGTFSMSVNNRQWETTVQIKNGEVILQISRGDREFVYAKEGNTPTLSANYKSKFQEYHRVTDVMLTKSVALSQ